MCDNQGEIWRDRISKASSQDRGPPRVWSWSHARFAWPGGCSYKMDPGRHHIDSFLDTSQSCSQQWYQIRWNTVRR